MALRFNLVLETTVATIPIDDGLPVKLRRSFDSTTPTAPIQH